MFFLLSPCANPHVSTAAEFTNDNCEINLWTFHFYLRKAGVSPVRPGRPGSPGKPTERHVLINLKLSTNRDITKTKTELIHWIFVPHITHFSHLQLICYCTRSAQKYHCLGKYDGFQLFRRFPLVCFVNQRYLWLPVCPGVLQCRPARGRPSRP